MPGIMWGGIYIYEQSKSLIIILHSYTSVKLCKTQRPRQTLVHRHMHRITMTETDTPDHDD